MFYASLIALAAVVGAGPANSAAPAGEADKKVCKRSIETGSVMPKTVCRTKAEWAALTAQAEAERDRLNMLDRSRATVGGSR